MSSEHTCNIYNDLLLNCTFETYWILLINVTIKKKKSLCRRIQGSGGTTTASAGTVAELHGGHPS